MNLAELQAELRHFAAERDWAARLTPKNMSTALMVGAADLAAIFQWMTPEESAQAYRRPDTKQRIGDGIADLLLYGLHLADQGNIDVHQAVMAKLAAHAAKYPAKLAIPRVTPVRAVQSGLHILLDYENVQPTAQELQAMAPGASQVWIFHGPHQKQIETRFEPFGGNVTLVPISKTGKNALDFHLSFYMGYIASRSPTSEFVVLSNDKGYEPVLEHARTLGFAVRQLGHGQPGPARKAKTLPSAPAKVVTAKKTAPKQPAAQAAPVKKVAAKKPAVPASKQPVQAKKIATKTAKKAAGTAGQTTTLPSEPRERESLLRKVTDNLRNMGGKRPVKPASLRRALKSFLGAEAVDQSIETLLGQLIASGTVSETANQVTYPGLA